MNNFQAVARHLQRLRSDELNSVSHFFTPMACVLEIGGGNGFQAKRISEFNCDVNSIDLAGRSNKAKFFDVIDYDGRNIPFEAAKFDILFTSNVLEHVIDIDNMMGELKRVLKPGGLAICIMPTPAWRFWSIISHYIYLIGTIIKHLIIRGHSFSEMMTIIPPSHGVFNSSFHELYYYSKWRWTKVFSKNNLQVIDCYPTGVFCTLYAIFPNLGISVRRLLAHILGSAGNIFIVQIKL
jgi:ubiquinone/menaquinone biosynthesis C-methylase UbiE